MAAEELQMSDLCVNLPPYEGAVKDSISLKECDQAEGGRCKKNKKPRRILHFSDGTLEEYSTDEEEEKPQPDPMALVDPKTLTWGPWMYYWLLYSGSSALSACDYVGESLASFLGITSPKYQYEIDEYHRCLEEEKAREEEEKAEMSGWSSPLRTTGDDHVVPGSTIQQAPVPSNTKQNLAEMNNDDVTSQIPTVLITSESNCESTCVSASQDTNTTSKNSQDAAEWERY